MHTDLEDLSALALNASQSTATPDHDEAVTRFYAAVTPSAILAFQSRLQDVEQQRDAILQLIASGLDRNREAKADKAAREARGEEDELERLRHWSDVRLWNSAHEKLLKAAQALCRPSTAAPDGTPLAEDGNSYRPGYASTEN